MNLLHILCVFFTSDTKMQFCSTVAKCSKSFATIYNSRLALKVMYDYVMRTNEAYF